MCELKAYISNIDILKAQSPSNKNVYDFKINQRKSQNPIQKYFFLNKPICRIYLVFCKLYIPNIWNIISNQNFLFQTLFQFKQKFEFCNRIYPSCSISFILNLPNFRSLKQETLVLDLTIPIAWFLYSHWALLISGSMHNILIQGTITLLFIE